MSSSKGPVSQDILCTAGKARTILDAEAIGHIHAFLESRRNGDLGFQDRSGKTDIYYTLFGLSCLLATDGPIHSMETRRFLKQYPIDSHHDFIHTVSLLRCRLIGQLLAAPERIRKSLVHDPQSKMSRILQKGFSYRITPNDDEKRLLEGVEDFRSKDGGYHHAHRGNAHGSVYAAFMALQVMQEYMLPWQDKADGLAASIQALETPDGGYANEGHMESGTTTATAAAIVTLRAMGRNVHPQAGLWLLQQHIPEAGFRAGPQAPVPDLLSTAVSLYALRCADISCRNIADSCLAFVDSLWNEDGGFCGSLADTDSDCEYTFYGLLALGCLADYIS